MKHLVLTLLLLVSFLTTYAQNSSEKIDSQIKLWLSEPKALLMHRELYKNGPTSNPLLPVIFKSSSNLIGKKLELLGGQVHTRIGFIYTGLVPYQSMIAFASIAEVERIEASQYVRIVNDNGIKQTGADKVQIGALPGGIAYTGKNVIVGVYDSGIDFAHPDFRKKNDNTQTRILSIWDQALTTGTKPQNYPYGAEFTQAQLNAALNNPNSLNTHDYSGHGTHVTGISAGLRGMAPDADIICVKADIHWDSDSTVVQDSKNILDGLNYIRQKAAQAGKPCVVNISLAYYIGSAHDGSSLIEQGLDYLVSNNPGFFISVATGNENGKASHFGGFELGADSIWTYMNTGMLYGIFNTANCDSVFVSFIVDSFSTLPIDWSQLTVQKTLYQGAWTSISTIKNANNGIQIPVFFGNGDTALVFKLMAANYDATRTEVRLFAFPGKEWNDDSTWIFAAPRLQMKGKGLFHAWWEQYQLDYIYNPIDFKGVYTNPKMRKSDEAFNVNILGCGKKTITTGAYVSRTSYKNVNGQIIYGANYNQDSIGSFAPFSNNGPTTDGRIKPEISAPGVNVISSLSRDAAKVAFTMVDARSQAMSGTSMAAPFVTGAIALYLEKNPAVNYDDLKSAITNNAIVDTSVLKYGAVPNSSFGYGKLDIYKAMGGRFHSSTDEINSGNMNLLVYPNPSRDKINFRFDPKLEEGNLLIFDVNGRLVYEQYISNAYLLNVQNWSKGIYFFRFGSNQNIQSGKFYIE